MKKLLIFFLVLGFTISIGINTFAYNKGSLSKYTRIKGITIISRSIIDVNDIKKHGYNTVFLQVDNIRKTKAPYNTNFNTLRVLGQNVTSLKNANLNFYICFMSGPGYSSDGKISTLYKNKYEMHYFSQMVKEIVKRYADYKNFLGISIDNGNPDIPREKFYETQNYIIDNVKKTYPQLQVSYNLHPLSYEEELKYLPTIKFTNIILNLNLALSGLSYPGYGVGYKTSLTINKNAILEKLEKFKEYQNKYDIKAVLTLETPWVKHTEILLQDLFEIFKMLDLDYNLHYGNSYDLYDISKNPSALKVLDRHNK